MFFRNLTAAQKGLVLVLVPVFFELLLLAILANTLLNAERTLNRIDYSRRAVLQLQAFQAKMVDALLTAIDQREGEAKQLAALSEVIATLQSSGRLGNLSVESNPELQTVLERATRCNTRILGLVTEWRDTLMQHQITAPEREKGLPKLVLMARVFELQDVCRRIRNIENRTTADEPQQLEQIRFKIILAVAIGISISFIVSFTLAALFTSDILNRLRRISASTHLLVAKAILPPPQPGRDELALLERNLYQASVTLNELRRRESAMLDNAVDIICTLDESLRFTGTNNAVERIWQYSGDEILGRSVSEMLEPARQNQVRVAFERIANGAGSGSVENRLRAKDGQLRDSLWRVKWSAMDKKFFCVVHDVTALRAVEKLRQQFLSMVCHDLRNPIMSVGVGLELLAARESASLSAAVRAELDLIKAGSENLASLTTEFLALEKLESGLTIINERVVSLQDACVVAEEMVAGASFEAGVEVKPPLSDGIVWADEERLILAIANMLSHAVNVSPTGSIVRMYIVKEADFVELQIVDNGPVISAEDRTVLFERFRLAGRDKNVGGAASIEETTTTSSSSSSSSSSPSHSSQSNISASPKISFGLATAKAIIEGHQGKVGATLYSNGRNCMWLRLPEYVPGGGDEP
jgi:PAS domain S-box-containing protein